MAKKPFAVRVEEDVTVKFRALSTVLNIDSAQLLEVLVHEKEQLLTQNELEAYNAILKVWGNDGR